MSERSFVAQLPPTFVVERALPTAEELAYGYEEGFLSRAGVVALALAKLEAGLALTPPEERAALLLSDEFDAVDDLMEDLQVGSEPRERRARFWLFMVLAWVLARRDQFDDPLGVVELVYADFEYPDEIQGLVRFMPLQPGHEAGVAALERHWADFVDRVGREYADRTAGWACDGS